LAHTSFRQKATSLDKGKGKRKSVKDWIDALIERQPSVEKDLEETSATIFDKTAILFSDPEFQKQFVQIPPFSEIIKQLIEWHVVDIPKPFDTIKSNSLSFIVKREMKDAKTITMKNGKPATQGVCPVCGTNMPRI